jgi:hypothetical protein
MAARTALLERPQPGADRWQQVNPEAVSIRIT